MTTKLQIIGPYTPEHEGPFCTRDGRPVRLLTKTDGSKEFPIVGFIDNEKTSSVWTEYGHFFETHDNHGNDLMNACEVPVAREFWVNEYTGVVPKNAVAHRDERDARSFENDPSYIRTIHVREVLTGDGE
ncbi:hypothetical protein HK16_04955 [Acetobacter senegalensis]|uniref:Uncharacterized protein n=2 Tax=Acetobacter TaxID=434 RepID=A0A252EDL8_9PROT|nr:MULTISPECIES: hypothetical protein [Acetobacter]ATJ91574.1 hypothetical protein CIW82_13590 [Acetobacter tropicalis]OUL64509.1 hypothetical protein HK16_04955 [Acetobacter senegalensis]